jgi:hypothetical protein
MSKYTDHLRGELKKADKAIARRELKKNCKHDCKTFADRNTGKTRCSKCGTEL